MLDRITAFFGSVAPAKTTNDPTGKLALAALMVEAARRDGAYEAAERDAILRILTIGHGLGGAEAASLLNDAETAQENAVDLFRFTHSLKESTPFDDRVAIIEDLWEVILSDGDRDKNEDSLMRSVCGLLGVRDSDSGLARQRVEERLMAQTERG